MELSKEISDIGTKFRKELTDFARQEAVRVGSDFNSALSSFFLNKLAEFEYRLRKLEEGKKRADGYLNLHTPLM